MESEGLPLFSIPQVGFFWISLPLFPFHFPPMGVSEIIHWSFFFLSELNRIPASLTFFPFSVRLRMSQVPGGKSTTFSFPIAGPCLFSFLQG